MTNASDTNKYTPNPAQFSKLKDKVVVLTGGASGIGASIVRALIYHGAHVVFGDINAAAASALTSSLNSLSKPNCATFVFCDTTKYDSVVQLFRSARKLHGRVDHAVACAGVFEVGSWFEDGVTVETVEEAESEKVVQVNVLGTLYFARVAVAYLKDGKEEGQDRSLTLVSSIAGFREVPGFPVYQCSKHAILGLLRALRNVIFPRDGIRVNAICPNMMDTPMASEPIEGFRATGCNANRPDQVVQFILDLEASEDKNGFAVYIDDGQGWEIEKRMSETGPLWVGEEPTNKTASK